MTDNQQPVAKESNLNCECPLPAPSVASVPGAQATSCQPANVVTIPVPIIQSEGTFAYVTVKGSLHDYTCTVFGLNQAEIQALSNRLSVKPCVNGVLIAVPPMVMLNTLAQLSYKVVCSCGEAEICWTMQREV
ncbi:uncharacterized protein LOC108594280 [Drosophila busckii]|uniref:uncharacterized protein LOC108594280 n=1 Tax=Drosophila busckii TaxID=30019 RepID=UPI00083EC3DB|nr:uncharacterized protein LOC108594280 [Drosophila busckii]